MPNIDFKYLENSERIYIVSLVLSYEIIFRADFHSEKFSFGSYRTGKFLLYSITVGLVENP